MHPELQEAIDLHEAIVAEAGNALVGYDTEKALANVVLLSEIPTTYDKDQKRQVNAGNLLLRGVPGVGKTFFGVILAAISNAKFARLQGRADLQPTEIVGFQMINPATGEFMTEFGPLASAEVILLDEINRIPLKSQSAFLEGLQDRTVTVGKKTYELSPFSFAIATMNPVELGQGTFPLSEAATDRFAIMINIPYLPPEEEEKLVSFDFKQVRLKPLVPKERIIELRAVITREVFLHEALAKYIRRLVGATRPYNAETRMAPPLAVGAGREVRGPRRVAARDDLLGPAGQGLGAADAQACRGLSRGRPGAGALRPAASRLARPARGQPRRQRRDGHRRRHQLGARAVIGDGGAAVHAPRHGDDDDAFVNLQEIAEIELFIIKRMKEFTLGDHASVFKGAGFNFVGVRDWEPGDRMSSIDWAQSSMTNFSPMITREFEQDSNATIVAVADASLSTRCGVAGVTIATAIARAVAAAGLSAMFFQDLFGIVTFDERFGQLASARPRIGRSHLLYCLDLYRRSLSQERDPDRVQDIVAAIESQVRKAALVPVISDFLFADADA